MAIVAVGDFDPDNFVDIITKYFGSMKPNESLPTLTVTPETPITTPIVREVKGLEAESIYLAWRLPAAKDKDMMILNVLAEVLQTANQVLSTVTSLSVRLLSAPEYSCTPWPTKVCL